MEDRKLVTRAAWTEARKALLADEKAPHARGRRARRAAAHAPLDTRREGLRLRHAGGARHAGRALRREEPARRLPLHVRPRLEAGLPPLLVLGRQLRRRRRAPRPPRHRLPRRLQHRAREDRGVPAADGLAVPLGLLARLRLQPRLPRLVRARGAGGGRRRVQLRAALAALRRDAGPLASSRASPTAASRTRTRRTGAASTSSTARTRSSTSRRRAATRATRPIRCSGCGAAISTARRGPDSRPRGLRPPAG